MDIKKLQALVIDGLEDVKAQDIKVFNTEHLTSLFDRIAIASGTSNRQTKALAASVRDKVKANGGNIVSIEGEETGEWVLVDLGDMIVHIMQPAIRAYYRLEEIWGEKEVKFGAAKRTTKKTGAPVIEEKEKPKRGIARSVEASQTTIDDDEPKKPARKTASKTSTGKPAAKTATKTAAKKPAARKTATQTVKVAVSKSVEAYKKTAAKKPAARKTASKPAAKKPAAKRTATKKSAD